MDYTNLKRLNTDLLDGYTFARFDDTGAVAHRWVLPGYFCGSDILFIGQMPDALNADVPEDKAYAFAYTAKEYEQLDNYYLNILHSSNGTIGPFIDAIYGKDWKTLSFTNVFKCPFDNNVIPDKIDEFELHILQSQIALLNPRRIVTIGEVAYKALMMIQESHPINCEIIKVLHPSYLKRSGVYNDYVKKYKKLLK